MTPVARIIIDVFHANGQQSVNVNTTLPPDATIQFLETAKKAVSQPQAEKPRIEIATGETARRLLAAR